MDVGWSFFLPCLDVEKAQMQLKDVEKLKKRAKMAQIWVIL